MRFNEEKRMLTACALLPFLMVCMSIVALAWVWSHDFEVYNRLISWSLTVLIFYVVYMVYLPMQGILDDFKSDEDFRKDYLEWLRERRGLANQLGQPRLPYAKYRQEKNFIR
jgi:hypothetical protein